MFDAQRSSKVWCRGALAYDPERTAQQIADHSAQDRGKRVPSAATGCNSNFCTTGNTGQSAERIVRQYVIVTVTADTG